MASPLGIGLIGCGVMGRSLGRQLREIEDARLVGVTDPDPAAAAAAAAELGAPAVGDAGSLVELPGVEAVVIASPGAYHRELTELAAGCGKHVFVEKPLAASVEDCDRMLAAVERAGVRLMVGQVLRYYPCWRQVLELVREGAVGDPWGVAVTRIGGGWAGWPQAWRNSRKTSGGLLMEVNAHEIDFMCQVCGDVERVYAEADHYGTEDPSDYPNLAFVSLRFRSGAVGMLHTSTVSAVSELSGKIQGALGTIHYTQGFGPEGEIRCVPRDGEPRVIRIDELEFEDPVRRELRLFVEAVQRGASPPISGPEGRRNVAIAEAAYDSARTGQPIRPARVSS